MNIMMNKKNETSADLTLQLIEAVIKNDSTMVYNLLLKGANPNGSLDAARITPLHHAAQNDSLETIPLLMEAGADIYCETEPDGLTPIEIALIHNHDKILQVLIAYRNNADKLMQ